MKNNSPAAPPACSICGKPTTWETVWIDNGAVYCSSCVRDVRRRRFGENDVETEVAERRGLA